MKNFIFSSLLREKMKEKGVTQAQLAAVAGCDQSAISGYLNGRIPAGDKLVAIAQALDSTAEHLMGLGSKEKAGVVTSEGKWKQRVVEAESRLAKAKVALAELAKKI